MTLNLLDYKTIFLIHCLNNWVLTLLSRIKVNMFCVGTVKLSFKTFFGGESGL